MGQCLMDRGRYDHEIPDQRALEVRLQESADLCARWHGRDDGRLRYAFTPRGGLNCSPNILRESARLASESGAYWQTHLAEDPQELAATRAAFPEARDYLDVFERAGGVGPRGIFAHSVHLSDEVQRMVSAQGRIAHCPSNLWADGGLMPLARYLRAGLVVGVGSDVGGSSDLSLFTALQLATITQRILCRYGGETEPILRPLELLRLGTLDGARVLGIEDRVGSVEVGKEADLILVDPARTAPLPDAPPRNADELATRLILHPHPEMVQAAWVRGRQLDLGRPYAQA
jgi:guanine deaminase